MSKAIWTWPSLRLGRGLALVLVMLIAPAVQAGELGAVGDLYVADESDDRARQFDGVTGELVGDFASGASYASGLVWAPNGNLLVSSVSGLIVEYDGTTGQFMRNIETSRQGGNRAYGPRAER